MAARIFSRDFYKNDTAMQISLGKLFLAPDGAISAIYRNDPNWDAQANDLLAVHQKIRNLVSDLQNPQSVAAQAWKQEIHEGTANGYKLLRSCVSSINTRVVAQNDNNRLKILAYKILNFFRSLFCCSKLDSGEYQSIDFAALDRFAKTEALELTEAERQAARHRLTIISENPPPELTTDNLQKLEAGLLEAIPLHGDYSICYEEHQRRFYIHYLERAFESSGEKFAIVKERTNGEILRHEMGLNSYRYEGEYNTETTGVTRGLDRFPLQLKEYHFFPSEDSQPIIFQIEPNHR
jgi:hypothetical protein